MTTTNDVTGDSLISKSTTDQYREGWDRIFGKKHQQKTVPDTVTSQQHNTLEDHQHESSSSSVIDDVGAFVPAQMNPDGTTKYHGT